VRNATIRNVRGTVKTAGIMHGLAGSPILNVKFEKCDIMRKRLARLRDQARDRSVLSLPFSVPISVNASSDKPVRARQSSTLSNDGMSSSRPDQNSRR